MLGLGSVLTSHRMPAHGNGIKKENIFQNFIQFHDRQDVLSFFARGNPTPLSRGLTIKHAVLLKEV